MDYRHGDRGGRLDPPSWHSRHRVLVGLRHALVRSLDTLGPWAGKSVLDFGCGSKPYRPLVVQRGATYLGADLRGNPDADVELDDRMRLDCPDEMHDGVLSTQVLEHVAEPAAYLAEARRLLKPGGHLVLSTHGTWPYHPDPEDYRRWTPAGLRHELRSAGLEPGRMESILGMSSVAMQLWQDATLGRLPVRLRSPYSWLVQGAIGLTEHLRKAPFSPDAAVFVVVARRPA